MFLKHIPFLENKLIPRATVTFLILPNAATHHQLYRSNETEKNIQL